MSNIMKLREYNEVKNKTFVVTSYRDGKRILTYSGLSLFQAMNEIIDKQSTGANCYLVTEDVFNAMVNSDNYFDSEAEFKTALKK